MKSNQQDFFWVDLVDFGSNRMARQKEQRNMISREKVKSCQYNFFTFNIRHLLNDNYRMILLGTRSWASETSREDVLYLLSTRKNVEENRLILN